MKKTLLFCITIFFSGWIQGQDFAKDRLENSPRHHEWIEIRNGEREIKAFVAYPEVAEKAKSVIVIHENRGLTDWVRSMADQLAEMGYIALAPDLLSDFDGQIRSTKDFKDQDEAREGIYKLDQGQVTQDLHKVFEYLQELAAGNGEVAVAGFCWGGSQAFHYATQQPALSEALVFYGTGPGSKELIEGVSAPVYGFYGENDQRVNASIEETEKLMKEANKTFEYEIYDGAGHAYMRSGEDPAANDPNKQAREKSLERMKKLLK